MNRVKNWSARGDLRLSGALSNPAQFGLSPPFVGAEALGVASVRSVSWCFSARASATGGTGTLAYAAAYDAAGQLGTQKLPGGVTTRTTCDQAGEPTALTYSGQVTPVTEATDADGTTVYTPGTPVQDQS